MLLPPWLSSGLWEAPDAGVTANYANTAIALLITLAAALIASPSDGNNWVHGCLFDPARRTGRLTNRTSAANTTAHTAWPARIQNRWVRDERPDDETSSRCRSPARGATVVDDVVVPMTLRT